MKALTVWFDLASPGTDAWFAQWAAAIEGRTVAIDWQPVRGREAHRTGPWLRLLWASAPPDRSPSRWLCGQALLRWAAADPPSLGAVPQRDPEGADVAGALQAATAAAAASGVREFPAVTWAGECFEGLAGLAALAQRLADAPSESP